MNSSPSCSESAWTSILASAIGCCGGVTYLEPLDGLCSRVPIYTADCVLKLGLERVLCLACMSTLAALPGSGTNILGREVPYKRENGLQIRELELRVAVTDHGMARPVEYWIWGGTCIFVGTDMSLFNFNDWCCRRKEVFVARCAATDMWSLVGLLTRPDIVERVEYVEPKYIVI